MFYNPVKINIDVNYLEIFSELKNLDKCCLITSEGFYKRGIVKQIKQVFPRLKCIYNVPSNPNFNYLNDLFKRTREYKNIIALGSGSVLDSAKIVALNYHRSLEDFIKNYANEAFPFSALNSFKAPPMKPLYAFPTSAGSSSELTPFATIWYDDFKFSLCFSSFFYRAAFYDYSLMITNSLDNTIASALDALSHSLEALWNKRANPISTTHSLQAIDLILSNLLEYRTFRKDIKIEKAEERLQLSDAITAAAHNISIGPYPISAIFNIYETLKMMEKKPHKNYHALKELIYRRNLTIASIHAGLSFSNTQTALAHAISYPLTLEYDIPHGYACSISLPILLECINAELQYILGDRVKNIKELFKSLDINFKNFNISKTFMKEVFKNLNERAMNSTLDINKVKELLLNECIKS